MNKTSEIPQRLYYLDWLRVLAMLGIFFFHNARFFDEFADWHVRNDTTNLGASIFVAFLGQWIMPLFFLIAGAGTYYAFKSKRVLQFVQERSLRLLIPLIFGMLVIVVPQGYFEALSHGETVEGNFFQIYFSYLKSLPDLEWFHLWFLAYLFVFSLIMIPIFFTRTQHGKSVVSQIAAVLKKPWVLFLLFVISIGAINAFIKPSGYFYNRESGGWNIIVYFLFFVYGYLIFANKQIIETIEKVKWITLGIGLIATACIVTIFIDQLADPLDYFGKPDFIISQFLQSLNTWSWLFTILGLASRYLKKNTRFLAYSNEAVLPFYILHQTIIIVIGYYVVQWNTGVALKYLTISSTSFIGIMVLYEFFIRRFNVLRLIFGMKWQTKRIRKELLN